MDKVATDGGNRADDTEVSHRGAEVHMVHRDVCGGPTDDRGVVVLRLVSPLICLWCDCVVAQWADMASPLLIVPVILPQCDYRVA